MTGREELKRRQARAIRRVFMLFEVALLLLTGRMNAEPLQAAQVKRSPASVQAPARPFTLDRLLSNLETIKATPTFLNEPTLISRVRKYGLAFQPTPEDLQKLRDKGASEELIKAIKERANIPEMPLVTAVPPEPPKPKEGRLTVTCKPVDCIVSVDKKQIGTTAKGELKNHVVPQGKKVTVSVTAENYVPDKEGVVIEIGENALVPLEFVFKLDPAALWAKGAVLFEGMIAALGGESALKGSGFFGSHGNLDVFSQANKTTYPFSTVVRLPAMARFEISKNKKYTIVKAESGFLWRPTPAGTEFDDLEDGLRYLTENHIARLVDRLRGLGARMEAGRLHFEPGEDVVFRVEREAYKYKVALNSEGRPKEITLESGGLNSGLKILLSNYQKQGAAFIPMTTEVVLPGAGVGMRGVIVRYESMELNPSGVKEEDFRPKKGFMSRGR